MPYLERIKTPHISIAPDSQEPLVDVLDREMQYLYNMETEVDIFQSAMTIAKVVRRSLRYESVQRDGIEVDPEALSKTQITNCYGYSLVLSEALERYDINHLIGFIDPHTFSVVVDEEGKAWVVDALAPHLSGELSDGASLNHAESAVSRAMEYGRSAMHFDGEQYVSRLASCSDKKDTLDTYRWLNYSRSKLCVNARAGEGAVAYRPAILGLYQKERGRNMMVRHLDFLSMLRSRDADQAYSQLRNLGDDYPLVDARELHGQVDTLIRQMIKDSLYDEAIDVVSKVYGATQSVTGDIRHGQWAMDWIAKIGRATESAQLLGCAAIGFRAVAGKSRYPQTPLKKAYKIENRLECAVN